MRHQWHSYSISRVLDLLNTSQRGLTEQEAAIRLKRYGLNSLPQKKSFSRLGLIFNQIKSPLIFILFIAGIIVLFLGEYADGIVIFGVVFLNGIIGYLQEAKACAALDKLKQVLQLRAVVVRENQEKEVNQEKIAPGDIIYLRAGQKAPADCRIIESHDLKINESALTGEWMVASKSKKKMPRNASLADRDNMAYLGTIIESGWGKGVVVATGLNTEIGKIAEFVREVKEKRTPYQQKLLHFSKVLGLVILLICIFIFIEGMVAGGNLVEIFTISVAVAVASIPEGLPVAMTVVLALGMQRILKRKGLVRRLASAETLGSTSIILTDKTGTLTEAKMRVAGVYTAERELLGDKIKKSNGNDYHYRSDMLALKIGMLCNESFIENADDPMKEWVVRGRPTEKSLFLAALQAGLSKKGLEKQEPVLDRVLFDSSLGYAASLRQGQKKDNFIYLVGAPEKILSFSSYFDSDGKKKKLDSGKIKELEQKQAQLTEKGYRLVGVAYKKTKAGKIDFKNRSEAKNFIFVGFFALHDPIRKKTARIMELVRQAGMKPIIVTGDHRLTAQAVAEKLGFRVKAENVIEGKDLAKLSEQEFRKKLGQIQIYARVEPSQKLRIVDAWQNRGEVVAMTGDGINDAPALKQADIGVAVESGTDVAKEVADLILLTNNFSIIEAAIEEGRVIIDNIRKIITYLLSSSFTEMILIGLSLAFGWPLPVIAVQILWVNLIEGGPIGMSLAFEKKEKDIMRRKPKAYSGSLLTKEMKTLIFIIGLCTDFLLLGLFFYLLKFSNYSIEHIRTIIFVGLAIDSILYIFSCRSLRQNLWQYNFFSNPYVLLASFFGLAMIALAVYLPVLQSLLRTVPLSSGNWILLLGLGIINVGLIELTKYYFITRKSPDRFN